MQAAAARIRVLTAQHPQGQVWCRENRKAGCDLVLTPASSRQTLGLGGDDSSSGLPIAFAARCTGTGHEKVLQAEKKKQATIHHMVS